MYTVRWDLALGMGILSLYPQSLLAKLTVTPNVLALLWHGGGGGLLLYCKTTWNVLGMDVSLCWWCAVATCQGRLESAVMVLDDKARDEFTVRFLHSRFCYAKSQL